MWTSLEGTAFDIVGLFVAYISILYYDVGLILFSTYRMGKRKRSEEAKVRRRIKRNIARYNRVLIIQRQQPDLPKWTPSLKKKGYPPPSTNFPFLRLSKNSMLVNSNWQKGSPVTEKDLDIVMVRDMFLDDPLFTIMGEWANTTAKTYLPLSKRKKDNSRGKYECVCFGIVMLEWIGTQNGTRT